MRNWFRTQPAGVADPGKVEAYREGRADERNRIETAPVGARGATRADVDAAYVRGRRERRVRRGSPFLTLLMVIAVLLAGGLIYLAIQQGSFSGGGAVVDQKIDQVSRTVDAPLKNAAETTGSALQRAGQRLK